MTPRLLFVVDSGTDVRLADGLAGSTSLRILARGLPSGREISQPSRQHLDVEVGPSGHAAFALFAFRRPSCAGSGSPSALPSCFWS